MLEPIISDSTFIECCQGDFHSLFTMKRTCEITEGELPRKQAKLVLAWTEIHKEELLADWELASNGELPFKQEDRILKNDSVAPPLFLEMGSCNMPQCNNLKKRIFVKRHFSAESKNKY